MRWWLGFRAGWIMFVTTWVGEPSGPHTACGRGEWCQVCPIQMRPGLRQQPDVSLQENGSFQFTLTSSPGRTHVLNASTNLIDWTPLCTSTPIGGSWIVVDANAASFQRRFYKAE